eukprot:305684-Pelagomonas_calceolata.AAC.1
MSIIQASSSPFWVLKEQQKRTAYFEKRAIIVYHEVLELSSKYKQCPPEPSCASSLRLAGKKGSWNHQVLTALNDMPHAQQFAAA